MDNHFKSVEKRLQNHLKEASQSNLRVGRGNITIAIEPWELKLTVVGVGAGGAGGLVF